MNIVSAQYAKNIDNENTSITVMLDNNTRMLSVPLDPDNTDYAELMRLVEAGELTIQEAD